MFFTTTSDRKTSLSALVLEGGIFRCWRTIEASVTSVCVLSKHGGTGWCFECFEEEEKGGKQEQLQLKEWIKRITILDHIVLQHDLDYRNWFDGSKLLQYGVFPVFTYQTKDQWLQKQEAWWDVGNALRDEKNSTGGWGDSLVTAGGAVSFVSFVDAFGFLGYTPLVTEPVTICWRVSACKRAQARDIDRVSWQENVLLEELVGVVKVRQAFEILVEVQVMQGWCAGLWGVILVLAGMLSSAIVSSPTSTVLPVASGDSSSPTPEYTALPTR
jgi:hypothetical protein